MTSFMDGPLENIHKETGRRCHHCSNFFSFDENVMKKHIFDNHRENLRMTRRNTKDADKLHANACKKEKKNSAISSNTTLKSSIKSEKDDTSDLEIEKHPIKIEVKIEVNENGIKKEIDEAQPFSYYSGFSTHQCRDLGCYCRPTGLNKYTLLLEDIDNQPEGDALKKSIKTETKDVTLEKNIKIEKEDISENQFEKHPINVEVKKEIDENFVPEQKSMCSFKI